jgi:transcriptional regulator with XRE-family HTH domain
LVGVGGSYGFGPQNKDEALVFASEGLRADIQYEILKALKAQNLSQTALAERLGCSSACVSQFLDDDANLTIESMAKVLLALDRVWVIDSVPCEYAYGAADANESEWSWLDLNITEIPPLEESNENFEMLLNSLTPSYVIPNLCRHFIARKKAF